MAIIWGFVPGCPTLLDDNKKGQKGSSDTTCNCKDIEGSMYQIRSNHRSSTMVKLNLRGTKVTQAIQMCMFEFKIGKNFGLC